MPKNVAQQNNIFLNCLTIKFILFCKRNLFVFIARAIYQPLMYRYI